MRFKLPRRLLLGAVLAAMLVTGYWLIFTQFMVYDDEGYVLWSLHNYFAAGGLYTKVFSQYGPFLYAFYHALHVLFRWPFDNETGRLLTLFYWCGSAVLGGWFAWRQSRNAIVAATATLVTFGSLLGMISEPGHPGGLLAFLSAIGAVGGAIAWERGKTGAFALLVGALAAAMVLTKVNVGAFFLIAAGSWLAVHTAIPWLKRASLWLTAVGVLLLPLALMHSLWPETWVAIFCLNFSCAALALLLILAQARATEVGFGPWLRFVGAGLGVSLWVVVSVHLRGTSLAMLWQGVVIAPLRMPSVYAFPADWPLTVPWLAVGLLVVALIEHARRPAWGPGALAALRLAAGAWLLYEATFSIDLTLGSFDFRLGPVFAWLMVVPLDAKMDTPANRARAWLGWVFVWQTLQAYPVAGSQMGWGSFLWAPLGVIGWYEAVQFLAARAGRGRRAVHGAGVAALILAGGILLGRCAQASTERYFTSRPLGLTGSGDLRPDDDTGVIYRILDRNIRLHGDELFSYPGMFSLNLWTARPTPTLANVTHWFSLLDDAEQQKIIDQLEHDARPVVVVQSYLVNYLVAHGFPPRGILQRYLVRNFAAVFRIDTFEFWVRRGRTVAPVNTALLLPHAPGEAARLTFVTDVTAPIASVELRLSFQPHTPLARFAVSPEDPWQLIPIRPDNSAAGPGVTLRAPTATTGLSRITASLVLDRRLPSLDQIELVLRDAAGQPLEYLRFTH